MHIHSIPLCVRLCVCDYLQNPKEARVALALLKSTLYRRKLSAAERSLLCDPYIGDLLPACNANTQPTTSSVRYRGTK